MGQLVFQANAGGQVALVGPNPASNFSLNVPAVNGNLVTTGDTGTVTNTMLAASAYNAPGTIGSVTPNTGKFTSVTNTGLTANQVVYASTGGLEAGSANMTFNGTTLTLANDASISGLTVGKGGGAVLGNTALGINALNGTNTGANNTGVGTYALYTNTSGTYNTAIGSGVYGSDYGALGYNTTGSQNTAVGVQSLLKNTTGNDNTAVGFLANQANTTGSYNVAIGRQALQSNTTASNNTAVGYQAGYSNTTGTNNVFVGQGTGYSNTTGQNNTFIGEYSGNGTTGSFNTFVGAATGYLVTSGAKNTIIGQYNGNQGGLDIRTANNYIVLSDGDGNPRVIVDNNGSVNIGRTTSVYGGTGMTVSSASNTLNAVVTTQNQSALSAINTANGTGTSASLMSFNVGSTGGSQIGTITYNGTNTLYNSTSDARLKKNVVDAGSGLEKLADVKIRSFDWIEHGNHTDFGVVAQELVEVAPEAVSVGDDAETIETIWCVDTSALVPAMIKAIQELKAEVDSLKAQLGK